MSSSRDKLHERDRARLIQLLVVPRLPDELAQLKRQVNHKKNAAKKRLLLERIKLLEQLQKENGK